MFEPFQIRSGQAKTYLGSKKSSQNTGRSWMWLQKMFACLPLLRRHVRNLYYALILLIIIECFASISWPIEFLDVQFTLCRSPWRLASSAPCMTSYKSTWGCKCWYACWASPSWSLNRSGALWWKTRRAFNGRSPLSSALWLNFCASSSPGSYQFAKRKCQWRDSTRSMRKLILTCGDDRMCTSRANRSLIFFNETISHCRTRPSCPQDLHCCLLFYPSVRFLSAPVLVSRTFTTLGSTCW